MILQIIIKTNVAKSDPKSDPLVDTHTSDKKKGKITYTDTTKVNSPHKLLTNREIPEIIQGVILPFNQTTVDGVATSGRFFRVVCAVLHKDIGVSATLSTAGVLKYPPGVNWNYASGMIPQDINTAVIPPRATTPVRTNTVPSVPPNYHRESEY